MGCVVGVARLNMPVRDQPREGVGGKISLEDKGGGTLSTLDMYKCCACHKGKLILYMFYLAHKFVKIMEL